MCPQGAVTSFDLRTCLVHATHSLGVVSTSWILGSCKYTDPLSGKAFLIINLTLPPSPIPLFDCACDWTSRQRLGSEAAGAEECFLVSCTSTNVRLPCSLDILLLHNGFLEPVHVAVDDDSLEKVGGRQPTIEEIRPGSIRPWEVAVDCAAIVEYQERAKY